MAKRSEANIHKQLTLVVLIIAILGLGIYFNSNVESANSAGFAAKGKAVCGDKVCSGAESVRNCPSDCSRCGDGKCTAAETSATCSKDCVPAPTPVCGDAVCNGTESLSSCPGDCSVCGDGQCTGSETSTSCSSDCVAQATEVDVTLNLNINNYGDVTVSLFDPTTLKELKRIALDGGQRLEAIAMSPDGKFAYVGGRGINSTPFSNFGTFFIYKVDLSAQAVVSKNKLSSLPNSTFFGDFKISPDGSTLLITSTYNGTIFKIPVSSLTNDLSYLTPTKIELCSFCNDPTKVSVSNVPLMVFSTDGKTAIVAHRYTTKDLTMDIGINPYTGQQSYNQDTITTIYFVDIATGTISKSFLTDDVSNYLAGMNDTYYFIGNVPRLSADGTKLYLSNAIYFGETRRYIREFDLSQDPVSHRDIPVGVGGVGPNFDLFSNSIAHYLITPQQSQYSEDPVFKGVNGANIVNIATGELTVIPISAAQGGGSIPLFSFFKYHPTTKEEWFVSYGGGSNPYINIVDTETLQLKTRVLTDSGGFNGNPDSFSKDYKYFLLLNSSGNSIAVYDVQTRTKVGLTPTGLNPRNFAVQGKNYP